LKQWAARLKCPILSIDYSLAPQAPFPRAIEEVFFAYCWALENLNFLGTTGERIVFAGDSAGANLNTGMLVKCIEMGVRIPDGILNIYGIYNVGFTITPSGALTLIDPFLPFGLTSNLMKSYAMENNVKTDDNGNLINGHFEHSSTKHKHDFTFQKSHYLSPYQASDDILAQFPPIRFLSTILDPLLDDSIEFGKKLRKLNVKVGVDVLGGVYHGFLYFTKVRFSPI
jgi:hormone-sensitive lipase